MSATPARIAVLDDYQRVALTMADWSPVRARATVDVFSDTVTDADALVARLEPFDALCVMRERTPLPREIIERLSRLKLIVFTGPKNPPAIFGVVRRHRPHPGGVAGDCSPAAG